MFCSILWVIWKVNRLRPTALSKVPAASQSTAYPPGSIQPSGHRQKRTWWRWEVEPPTSCWWAKSCCRSKRCNGLTGARG